MFLHFFPIQYQQGLINKLILVFAPMLCWFFVVFPQNPEMWVRSCICGSLSATNALKKGWKSTGMKQQGSELSDPCRPTENWYPEVCNSFSSPLCWEIKWNYLGGPSCRNWAKPGCVSGFLSWTGVTGLSWGWHKGGAITPAAPAEGSQGNWIPGTGQDNDCHRYQTLIYVILSHWSSVCGPHWGLCILQQEVLLGVCDSES